MGMSSDYISAIKNSATYVRIGSNIFGQRTWFILILDFLLINFNIIKKSFLFSAIQPAVDL
jgi:hypothetical protein